MLIYITSLVSRNIFLHF